MLLRVIDSLPWRHWAALAAGVAILLMPLTGCSEQAAGLVPRSDSAAREPVGGPSEEELPPLVDPPPRKQPASHQRMLTLLKDLLGRQHTENYLLSDVNVNRLRAQFDELPADASVQQQWMLQFRAGQSELIQGNEAEALDHYAQATKFYEKLEGRLPREIALEFLLELAVANMRLGETQNCCLRKSPDNCLLPIQGGGIHTKQEGSRRAIEVLTNLLRNSNRQMPIHMRAMWLLNIAYMTVGDYPSKVPPQYLIPPEAFESEEPFPKFENIAQKVKLDNFNLAGGAIADDFNNDGYLDLVVSDWDLSGQIHYYRNNRDGSFADCTAAAGLLGITGGLNMAQADFDNDGFVDFVLSRGAWLGKGVRHPLSLVHNNGDGTFTDVTFDAGMAEELYPTQAIVWADYDNDGFVDLFVGGEATSNVNDTPPTFAPCRLFHNNGDGTFTDKAAAAGVVNDRFVKGASWGDYDNDGHIDLYVSNLGQPNRLYRNNADGTFTDVAIDVQVTQPMRSFACWFWDVDNDGQLDLWVSAYRANPEHLAASYLGISTDIEPACLYRGNGHGGFDEVAEQYNLLRPVAPMGSNFGDLDNDGYLDFYLATGTPAYTSLMPNILYHNRGGKSFADVTTAANMGNLQKGHGVSFADLDNDGDLDVFAQTGGAVPGDKFYNALYENPGFENHWLGLRLVGKTSNRSAIGARLHAEFVDDGERRHVYRHVNSGGSFGANPLRQTLGLGKAEKIDRLEILWPATGKTEVLLNLPADRVVQVVEGEGRATEIKLKKLELGAADK